MSTISKPVYTSFFEFDISPRQVDPLVGHLGDADGRSRWWRTGAAATTVDAPVERVEQARLAAVGEADEAESFHRLGAYACGTARPGPYPARLLRATNGMSPRRERMSKKTRSASCVRGATRPTTASAPTPAVARPAIRESLRPAPSAAIPRAGWSAPRGRCGPARRAARVSATPIPCGSAYDVPSSPTHSPTGSSVQRDGQVGVDEREAFAVDGHPHAVAEVGHRRDPLQRRRLLAGDHGHPQAEPHGGPPGLRCTETDRSRADLDRVPEAERASLGEGERRRSAGRRRVARRRGSLRVGEAGIERCASAARSARTTSVSPAKSDPCTICTFFPGRIDGALHAQGRERHRTHQVDGEPRGEVGWSRLEALQQPREQRRRSTAVLRVRRPRAACDLGRDREVAVEMKDRIRLRHGAAA